MRSKAAPFLLLLILVVAFLFINKWKGISNEPDSKRKRGFDRSISALEYTKHALCRMDCRHITKSDIEDVMRSGEINYAKTNVQDKPCPTYALQGYTSDGQHIRVIFAQCEHRTKVVTCYDLEKDYECYCPGDEKKKKRIQPNPLIEP